MSPLSVAYVVSMAAGLHSFVLREVRELASLGVIVHIFPTKVRSGPYMPPPDSPVHRPTLRTFVLAHSRFLVRHFRGYMASFHEAMRFGAVVDFALAVFFAVETERCGVQLVHCHFGDHKLFIGHFVGQLSARPVTVTIHAYELYNNPNPRLFRESLRTVRAIISVSEYNRSVLEKEWSVPPGRARVIPLFADIPPEPSRSATVDGKVIVLTVARFVEKKGHATILAALARLPENFEAWFAGTGPLDLKTLAKSFQVEKRVRILGLLSDSDLRAAYRTATVFCLPSETTAEGDREGIPVALMEAMAYGLPVVTTRHAGIPELVEEILVEEGDVEGVAASLLKLGGNPLLRKSQGQKNRDIIVRRFSRRNVLVLKALLEDSSAPIESPRYHSRKRAVE